MFSEIDKDSVLALVIDQIDQELQTAITAARTAELDATNEESRPENQYDTRALEASYIARGQVQRVSQLREALFEMKKIRIKSFDSDEPIASTALLEIESDNKKQILFFAPLGGGIQVTFKGFKIQVITPTTPLGQALLQARVGESVLVGQGPREREYTINQIK